MHPGQYAGRRHQGGKMCFANVDVFGAVQDRGTCYPTKEDANNKTNGFPYPGGGQIPDSQGGHGRIVAGADGEPILIVPVLPCPSGQFWDTKVSHCMPNIPSPPPYELPPLHPIQTSGDFGDDFGGFDDGMGDWENEEMYAGADAPIVPVLPCPSGQFWSESASHCMPNIPAPPPYVLPPLHPVAASGDFDEYAGGDAPIVPVLPCPSGQFWSESAAHCMPNIPAPPPYTLPPTLSDWHAQHVSGFVVGAAAPVSAIHAQNAVVQAQSAQQAATHPAAQGTTAHQAAQSAQVHAAQAQSHAQAAQSHPDPRIAAHHSRQAESHMRRAGVHAQNAHREIRGEGRGLRGMFRGFFGGERGRYGHLEWRGVGHPRWRRGINRRWLRYRAECFMRRPWGCLKERIWGPYGHFCYRITPAGAQEGIELEVDEIAANTAYQSATGEAAPGIDDGPLPGSEKTADGSATPPDDATDTDQSSAQAAADPAVVADTSSDDAVVDDDTDATATTGEYAGWQMPFTDPSGFYDYSSPAAWDGDFSYPGWGWNGYW